MSERSFVGQPQLASSVRIAALSGRLAHERPAPFAVSPEAIERVRKQRGGSITGPTRLQFEWFHADVEAAMFHAASGDISMAARLWKASRTDGVVSGLLSTRTDGLVRLPKKFRGPDDMTGRLRLSETAGGAVARSEFDLLCPPAELAGIAADGVGLGVGVGEFCQVQGRSYPVLVRLPPEFLRFRTDENRWYYNSIAGQLPITPGDGRWVLHTPGGRVVPWEQGQWAPVGGSWISKIHARGYSDLWQAKLANPARVAESPEGASEEWDDAWFQAVADWGAESVFAAKPGYKVSIVESNGRGAEIFERTQTRAENEIMVALAGQVVTTTGGSGFANADIHKSIRADLIQATADALAYTVNTQCLPIWVQTQFGDARLIEAPVVEWSVLPPKDKAAEALAMGSLATALGQLCDVLAKFGRELEVVPLLEAAGIQTRPIPIKPTAEPASAPTLGMAA